MTQPQQPYPPQHQPYGSPQPPKKRRWPLIVGLVCGIPIALLTLVTCVGVVVSASGDDGGGAPSSVAAGPPPVVATASATSAPAPAAPATPTGPAAPTGFRQHPEDVEITRCGQQETLGWLEADLKVTNNSGKASTYIISVAIESEDGKTLFAEGSAFVSRLEPGQSTTEQAITAKEAPAGVPYRCRITDATRSAA